MTPDEIQAIVERAADTDEPVCYQHIHFVRLPTPPRRKTPIWSCRTNRNGDELGQVRWYSSWRQFCYFPTAQAVYSAGCLADIQTFIRQLRVDDGGR